MGKKSSNLVVIVHRLQPDCLIAFEPASTTGQDRRSILGLSSQVRSSSIVKIFAISSYALNLKPLVERWRAQEATPQPIATKWIGYSSRPSATGQMRTKRTYTRNWLQRMRCASSSTY